MSDTARTETKTKGIRTVGDFFRFVTPDWHDAEIAISINGGERNVARVSLCTNAQGRRVVIVHHEDFSGHLIKLNP